MVIPLSCAAILMTVDAESATGTNRQLIERQLPAVLPEAKDQHAIYYEKNDPKLSLSGVMVSPVTELGRRYARAQENKDRLRLAGLGQRLQPGTSIDRSRGGTIARSLRRT